MKQMTPLNRLTGPACRQKGLVLGMLMVITAFLSVMKPIEVVRISSIDNPDLGERAVTTSSAPADGSVPAFPEAEGFGANSVGGRGGRVIEVTNLNDSGPGSLRAALEAEGPRIVVFRVAGLIKLKSMIDIRYGNLTVAGQTAPGSGIYITRDPDNEVGIMLVGISRFWGSYQGEFPDDVIIRYVRIRPGRSPTGKGDGPRPMNLQVWSGSNIIFDHITSGWNNDNLMTVAAPDIDGRPPLSNVTIQRSIFAESLEGHSTGLNIQGQNGDYWRNVKNIAVHHNLFASNTNRNPRTTSMGTKVVNNVVYNWRFRVGSTSRGSIVDWINNYWKAGPLTNSIVILEHDYYSSDDFGAEPSIHISGNIALPQQPDPNEDNWNLYRWSEISCELNPSSCDSFPVDYRRFSPLPKATYPINVQSASEVYNSVLSDVGANARLDCQGNWVANLDPIDTRIISEVWNNTGTDKIIYHEDDVGGFPEIDEGSPCPDADHDGMPDEWESLYYFNPNDPSDGPADTDRDGYTNVEEYLNGTDPKDNFFLFLPVEFRSSHFSGHVVELSGSLTDN